MTLLFVLVHVAKIKGEYLFCFIILSHFFTKTVVRVILTFFS